MVKAEKSGDVRDTAIVREADGRLRVGSIRGIPDITSAEIGEIGAWFLGPRAENARIFRTMIDHAVEKTVAYRKSFEPDDPPVITETVRETAEYKRAVENMLRAYEDLVEFLQEYTTPYFSMRYQGHMLRDTTLPALCGYFAAMLHNPNNVTIQASSATTPLEIIVGRDLCAMVGFPEKMSGTYGITAPWAHITCDGSVANLEACWSLREAKFLPVALRRMLLEARSLRFTLPSGEQREVVIDNENHPVTVTAADGSGFLLTDDSLDSWQLLNLPLDELLSLPGKIAEQYSIGDEYVVWSAAIPYGLNYTGWGAMMGYLGNSSGERAAPVIVAPVTMHYSLLKSAALLGVGFGGSAGIAHVAVDKYGRMDMTDLEEILSRCLQQRVPVGLVVGVVGTTEEGAVDNLVEMLRLREKFRKKGMEFFIHADSAWGGYMVSAMRRPFTFIRQGEKNDIQQKQRQVEGSGLLFTEKEAAPFSDYVYDQLSCIRKCDTVTIDPHKMGYVQYPAGAILYRNGGLRRLTTFTGPYIGGTGSVDPGKEPTAGIFGIEGSRPGAAPAAVFMSHRVIRPDITGHGKIIRQSMLNARLFALHLFALGQRSSAFDVTLLSGGTEPCKDIGDIDPLTADPAVLAAVLDSGEMRNFGPDLNIVNYVFNPLCGDGTPNRDVGALNDFNLAVYEQFHVPVAERADRSLPVPMDEFPKLFITMTTFGKQEYGERFMGAFLKRVFRLDETAETVEAESIVCLRSVIMDPFIASTGDGDFGRTIANQLEQTLTRMVEEWRDGRRPPAL